MRRAPCRNAYTTKSIAFSKSVEAFSLIQILHRTLPCHVAYRCRLIVRWAQSVYWSRGVFLCLDILTIPLND